MDCWQSFSCVRTNDGYLSSDSEAEDTPETKVLLPQDFSGNGNLASGKSAIRLKEIGPRLTMRLVKIEDGLSNGQVLYHRFVKKTPEEKEKLAKEMKKKQAEKKARRKAQQQHVASKVKFAEKRGREEEKDDDEKEDDYEELEDSDAASGSQEYEADSLESEA